MKRLPRFSLHLLLLLCLAISAAARPRPVPPPWPEQVLARWHFDELLLAGTSFSLAELAAAHRAESWSGCALTRNGESAPPVWLSAVDATGRTNLALGTGALRFWFRPDWTSGEGLRAGSFPRLLELARATAGGLEVLWSLHLDADGSTLYLTQVDSRRAEDLLSAPVAWRAGEWHLVTLVWRPTGAALYLDGALADLGGGVTLPAGVGPVTVGIALGSDVTGGNLAQGQFEEVTSLRTFDPVRQSYYYANAERSAED